MTFDEFRKDFLTFLEGSTVNLGRKKAKTRQDFMDTATAKFDIFTSKMIGEPISGSVEEKPTSRPMSGSVICIKPTNKNKALDVGKGVHAMTASESMRADEQLNRSPYSTEKKKEGKQNE